MGEILFRARFGQLISQEALHIFELFRRAVVSETEATLLANPSEIRRRLEAINTRPANTSEREWLANEKLRIDTCKNLKKTLAEGNGVTP